MGTAAGFVSVTSVGRTKSGIKTNRNVFRGAKTLTFGSPTNVFPGAGNSKRGINGVIDASVFRIMIGVGGENGGII